jgi:hypothetical protein
MFIDRTYGVTEESGLFYVTADGEPIRNYAYPTSRQARNTAANLTRANALWKGVFAIETRIAEALAGQPWPYGATCVNHGTDADPEWTLTEPYRNDSEATRPVHPDPTGHVQITVYTRDLYETACKVADVKTSTDDDIRNYYISCGHGEYVPVDTEAIEAVRIRLGYRRLIGITIENDNTIRELVGRLDAAGLLLHHYTRDQYTAACEIVGVEALTDDEVKIAMTTDAFRGIGIRVDSAIPTDTISTNLARRRALGMGDEQDATDETAQDGK